MSRCPECDKVLTLDDAFGHDCEVAVPTAAVYPSNLWIWRSVVNVAEAQLIAERSAKGEVFAIDYADSELARMYSEEEIREARLEDRRALQSLTNFIVLGNG